MVALDFGKPPESIFVLAGGMGTRLKGFLADDEPKPMISFEGRPFLHRLVDQYFDYGFLRIILCLGHGRAHITSYFDCLNRSGVKYSIESTPLGSGGALKHALAEFNEERFFVSNGDTFFKENFRASQSLSNDCQSAVFFSRRIVNEQADEIKIAQGKAEAFCRSAGSGTLPRPIFAGLSLLERSLFLDVAPARDSFSLEIDILPSYVSRNSTIAVELTEDFLDFGTPKGLSKAKYLYGR